MIQVGQYYFGDSGVKWVSFQLVLTLYRDCSMRDKALDVSCCVSGDISAPVCSDETFKR